MPAANRRKRTATASSSAASAVSSGPRKKSASGDLARARRARPPRRRRRCRARTAGISPAGSAWAMRADRGAAVADRGVGDVPSAWRSSGGRGVRRLGRARGRRGGRARPPVPPSAVTVDGRRARRRRLMSTRWAGDASRMLRIGIRLWPPASTLPSCRPRRARRRPRSTVRGAWCSNGAGFTERSCLRSPVDRAVIAPGLGDLRRPGLGRGRRSRRSCAASVVVRPSSGDRDAVGVACSVAAARAARRRRPIARARW